MRIIRDCTKDNPFSPEKDNPGDYWRHHGAYEIGEQEKGWFGGDVVRYRCKFCGTEWKEELPQ